MGGVPRPSVLQARLPFKIRRLPCSAWLDCLALIIHRRLWVVFAGQQMHSSSSSNVFSLLSMDQTWITVWVVHAEPSTSTYRAHSIINSTAAAGFLLLLPLFAARSSTSPPPPIPFSSSPSWLTSCPLSVLMLGSTGGEGFLAPTGAVTSGGGYKRSQPSRISASLDRASRSCCCRKRG